MKYLFFYQFYLSLLLVTMATKPCPTCIGRIDATTPPLFSKEYDEQYTLHDDGTLEVAQLEESHDESE